MEKKRGGKAKKKETRWRNLTPARINLLQKMLLQRLSKLNDEERTQVLGSSGGHSELIDCSQSATETDSMIRRIVRIGRIRKNIVAALERIRAGRIGVCSDCGEPIDPERLHLNPEVEFCPDCQHENDLAEKDAQQRRQ